MPIPEPVPQFDGEWRPQGSFTRWADSPMAPLVRGQRVTFTGTACDGVEWRVTDITPHEGGGETYTLELAADVDARLEAVRRARREALDGPV